MSEKQTKLFFRKQSQMQDPKGFHSSQLRRIQFLGPCSPQYPAASAQTYEVTQLAVQTGSDSQPV